jgi:nitrous oxide reductase accessory protein NosL
MSKLCSYVVLALALASAIVTGCAEPPAPQKPGAPAPAAAPAAPSAAKSEEKTEPQEISCKMCGMPVDKESENRFVIETSDAAKTEFCCAMCVAAYRKTNSVSADKISVVDYKTHAMIPAAKAYYLHGSKLSVLGAMPPTVAAFASREEAEAVAKKEGGKTLDWEQSQAELAKSREAEHLSAH